MLLNMPAELCTGNIIKKFTKNNVTLTYYGGELCDATVNNKNIEDLFEIKQASSLDDELCYRITDETISYLLEKINQN